MKASEEYLKFRNLCDECGISYQVNNTEGFIYFEAAAESCQVFERICSRKGVFPVVSEEGWVKMYNRNHEPAKPQKPKGIDFIHIRNK